MINRFMLSVAAAALIAGTGLANAQGNMGHEAPAAGSATHESAPAAADRAAPSAAAPMNRDSDSAAPKSAQSEEKMQPPGNKAQRAQGDMKAGPQGEKSAQDGNTNHMKAEGRDSKNGNMNAETKSGTTNADSKTGNTAQTKSATESRSQTTTGNAATSATAAPPAEKRTQIASAFKSEKITETTNVNFEINVGTRVPDSVHFYPLPPRIVEIYPEWSGYDVIFVHGRYIIVRPESHEIVYIIEG
jgi:hypothetical protein